VERWNSGFSKDIIHLPNVAVSQAHFSNIPTFHCSNWGEAPNLIQGFGIDNLFGHLLMNLKSFFISILPIGCRQRFYFRNLDTQEDGWY